jgi:hypothetical protein
VNSVWSPKLDICIWDSVVEASRRREEPVYLRILPQLVTWAKFGSAELSSGHLSLDSLKFLDISILVEALYKNTSLFIHKHDTVTVTVLRVTCRRLNRLILADITYVVIPTEPNKPHN